GSGVDQAPDVLGRESLGPLQGRVFLVGRLLRIGARPKLDQIVEDEAAGAEQADPITIGEHPLDRRAVLILYEVPAHGGEVVALKLSRGERIALIGPADPDPRGRDVENEPAPRPEYSRDL